MTGVPKLKKFESVQMVKPSISERQRVHSVDTVSRRLVVRNE